MGIDNRVSWCMYGGIISIGDTSRVSESERCVHMVWRGNSSLKRVVLLHPRGFCWRWGYKYQRVVAQVLTRDCLSLSFEGVSMLEGIGAGDLIKKRITDY